MHFILIVRDAIDRFDPMTDLLVSEDSFLTWRRWDQDLPNSKHTRVYAVANGRWTLYGRESGSGWFLTPAGLQKQLYPGINAWLERTAVDAEHGRLGIHMASRYYGLLAPITVSPEARGMIYNKKVRLLSELTKEITFPSPFPFEPHPIAPEMEWDSLREEVIGQLLFMHSVNA